MDPVRTEPVPINGGVPPETTALQRAPAAGLPVAVPAVKQLSERPVHEVFAIADELGIRRKKYKTLQQLIIAIHARRQLIVSLNRDAMVDVLRWSHRPAPAGASKEGLAHQIIQIRTMRFEGLSQRGLVVLAVLRGLEVTGDETVPKLIKRLKKQESTFAWIGRKRRKLLGSLVSKAIGGEEAPVAPSDESHASASPSIQHEIEEAGLFGGLAGRIKKSADGYVNQKLDEIEARIDRKLDEIDRRLAEWRDKEVANRIRILKITLWASVVVGIFSLLYSYIKIYL